MSWDDRKAMATDLAGRSYPTHSPSSAMLADKIFAEWVSF